MAFMAGDNRSLQKSTIEEVVKTNLCTGCGTCVAICPNEAIKLVVNGKKRIYIPKINDKSCDNCGICYKTCPGHSVDYFKQLNLQIFGKEPDDILIGIYINCYTGHATDYDIRYNSASGGLVTQLLIFALEEGIIDGALVTRMSKKYPLEPEPFIARTKEEIIGASKSKYCPVPANIALKEILESKEDERFAVVGLPCHIHGIRKAELISEKLKEKIILHIGIFCGTTKSFLGTTFQLKRMRINENEIEEFSYRGEGWPGSLVVLLKDKEKKISELYYDYYDSKFCSFTPWRCTLCSDHTCELADISFGDAWLPELANDKIGTSIIISRSKVAEEILQSMASRRIIELNEIDSGKVALSQGMFRFKKDQLKARIFFFKLFGKKIPIYDQKLPRPKLSDYLMAMWQYFWIYVSSKRYLWILFNAQTWITKVVKYFRPADKKVRQ
jgi:coenzyme F420 hydrogenase subunit beta